MREKPSYYAILTAEVRYDKRLNLFSRLLYAEITSLSNKSGICWAGNKYFADAYDTSTRTVQRGLEELKKYGYISVHIVYKENSKEIERREIRTSCTGVKNDITPNDEIVSTPTDENVVDNNTSILNTTSNNNKDNSDDMHVPKLSLVSANNTFEEFWSAYPRKQSKSMSRKAWGKIDFKKVSMEKIMKSLDDQKKTESWVKDNGKYIPLASSWINQERWDDELDTGTCMARRIGIETV